MLRMLNTFPGSEFASRRNSLTYEASNRASIRDRFRRSRVLRERARGLTAGAAFARFRDFQSTVFFGSRHRREMEIRVNAG